ncbi:MAG: hypothetical protein AAF734_06255, partial [Bacteroidota bacterium]
MLREYSLVKHDYTKFTLTMRPMSRERLLYRFEKFIGKGGSSIFISLFFIFIASFLLMIIFRWVVLQFLPDWDAYDSYGDHLWGTYLQMTDPGNMNYDNRSNVLVKITTVLTGFIGVVIFSTFIAFLTTSVQNSLYQFRKGTKQVLEEHHTLILGWNERALDIISELVIANESEKKACVVILAEEDKEEMDDAIYKNILDAKTTRVITRTGSASSINQLKRISAHKAKSVIILTTCADNASEEQRVNSDNHAVKVIMALTACQGGKNKLPIIAEIFSEEKRQLISFFNDEKIISIASWKMMGKLLLQTSLTSGLERVYYEILSFAGNEIYFHRSQWNGIQFYNLPYHFKDGIPLGVYRPDGQLILRPPKGFRVNNEDAVVMLAQDNSTIHFSPQPLYIQKRLSLPSKTLLKTTKRTLILGWHDIAATFIHGASTYLMQDSTFDIIIKDTSQLCCQTIQQLQEAHPSFTIQLLFANPLHYEELKQLQPFGYDNIIILSQDEDELSAEKIDSDTLMILIMLRKIISDSHMEQPKTKIITQVLHSENQDLLIQTDVDDFITS